MPRSSDDVATTARSLPDAIAASTRRRCSTSECAVVQRNDGQCRLVQLPQRLEHQLRLGARVDEHDGHAGEPDACHHPGRSLQAHVAGPGQFTFRQHHRELRRRAVGLFDHSLGTNIGADRVGVRHGGQSPTRRRAGPALSGARRTGSWSPRFVPASACTSSITMQARPTNIAVHRPATAAPPVFPAWSAECSAG